MFTFALGLGDISRFASSLTTANNANTTAAGGADAPAGSTGSAGGSSGSMVSNLYGVLPLAQQGAGDEESGRV